MKTSTTFEAERENLIARLAHIELNPSLIKKMDKLLTPKSLPPMPCQLTVTELNDLLEKQRLRNEAGVSHEEFMKEVALW